MFYFAQEVGINVHLRHPYFDSYYVNMNTMGERSSIGGITFVDHPEHPSLYNFSSKICFQNSLINGVESRSVAHDVCVRLMYTSASDTEHDDWASIIAAHAQNRFYFCQMSFFPVHHLVISIRIKFYALESKDNCKRF